MCLWTSKQQKTLQIFIPQTFEVNAPSSGGIQTLIDRNINKDHKIMPIQNVKITHLKEVNGVFDFA